MRSASERPLLFGGTEGSNLASSSGESRANLFRDREHIGDWRVEKLLDDGESCEVAIFGGGDARQRAIRYADREYGAFDEIELEPYNYQSP